MVQQEVIEAELRHLQSWNDHAHNSRKSIVVVTIYDSDEEDGSSSRTASCSTPEDNAGDRNSPDLGEIAIIEICPNSKSQTSSLNLQSRQTIPMVPTNAAGAQENDSVINHTSVCNIAVSSPVNASNVSNNYDTTSPNDNSSHIYLETIGKNTGHREDNDNYMGESRYNYNHDNRQYIQRPSMYDNIDFCNSARNFIFRLKEAAENMMNGGPLRNYPSSDHAIVDRQSRQQSFKYQTSRNLFNSYTVISENVPLDYSTKNRAEEKHSHETNNISNEMVYEQYTVDISKADRPDVVPVIVNDINTQSEDGSLDGYANEGAVDSILVNDGSIAYTDELKEGMLIDAPNEIDDFGNSPVSESSCSDAPLYNNSIANNDADNIVGQSESPEEEIPDITRVTIEDSPVSRPMQRRSKRIPNKQSGGEFKRKKKNSETVNGRTRSASGANDKKQLNRKASSTLSAVTKRDETASKSSGAAAAVAAAAVAAAAAAEKRVRRGGVATRARSRNLQSEGSVWRRPTPSDIGPRRSWPAEGMHERPVWPLAGDAAPSSPPRPSPSPSPDPADLARQRDIEIRLHWALASCFQVHKDAKEIEKQKLNPRSQTYKTLSARSEDRSVQEIYIESRLYRFLDNELSKLFSKNGKMYNKVGDLPKIQSKHPFYYTKCSLFESLKKCLLKEITSNVEESISPLSAPSEQNNIPDTKNCNGIYDGIKYRNSNLESNNAHYASSLDERKDEILEKVHKYAAGNFINKNICNSLNSQDYSVKNIPDIPSDNVYSKHNTAPVDNRIDYILDAICSILYPIAKEYCKINNITPDELVSYLDTLTPNLLMEWIHKNIEYEAERI